MSIGGIQIDLPPDPAPHSPDARKMNVQGRQAIEAYYCTCMTGMSTWDDTIIESNKQLHNLKTNVFDEMQQDWYHTKLPIC